MKTKVSSKKVGLNKQTVAHLSLENMIDMKGGLITAFSICICSGLASDCICPQTDNCGNSGNGCDTDWLGLTCLTCFTDIHMISDCNC